MLKSAEEAPEVDSAVDDAVMELVEWSREQTAQATAHYRRLKRLSDPTDAERDELAHLKAARHAGRQCKKRIGKLQRKLTARYTIEGRPDAEVAAMVDAIHQAEAESFLTPGKVEPTSARQPSPELPASVAETVRPPVRVQPPAATLAPVTPPRARHRDRRVGIVGVIDADDFN